MEIKKRPTKNKREKTVEINVFSLVFKSLVVVMGVILLFLALHFIKQFVSVNSFETEGESVYEASQLASAAGIEVGDKSFRIDTDEAESKLLQNCPYLLSAEIERSLFGKITFVVECYEPVWYIEISGDYYVLDKEFRVLEETKEEERLYQSDLIYLTLPHVKSAIVGEILVFGAGDGEIEETKKIMEIILNSKAFEMICSADIDNRYDVHFEFDKIVVSEKENTNDYEELTEVFTVNIGGYTKLETKLEYVYKAIVKENLEGAIGGTIDVSESGDKVSIRPKYASADSE